MNLKTFFEKFELFADAPDAVPRMRRFILDLAVRGKLVEQDPKDEPADELLKRVQAEKTRLIKSGEIKDQEQLPPVADDAIPFSLPIGWAASQLGDVAVCLDYMREPINGTERDLRIAGKAQSELFPYYGATQQQGWIDDFIFNAELVLLGEDGVPFFDALRSKAYLISGKTWVNNHAHVFRGILVSNPFVVHWLNTFDYTGRVAGSTRSKLNQAKAVDIPIALPPLAEQKRIVAKVDELMALCDRLEAQQQERETRHAALARASLARFAESPTPANLNFLFHKSYTISPSDLRQSILNLAFAGKLVPQDPKDEPASVLLEKARAEKARLIEADLVKKEPWADKLQDATTLYDLPPGWEWTHVSDVVEKVTVGFVGSMKEQYRAEGVPFLRCQNVRENRYEPIGLTFISEEFHRTIAKSTLRPGDVVVTRSGNVGVTCVIPDCLPEANCSDLVIVKRPLALVPAFLSYFINSIATGQIEAKTVGIALTHFNTQSVAQMTVVLPPLAEQRRIVAKVEQLMALVDALETQLATARTTAGKLMEAIVSEITTQQ